MRALVKQRKGPGETELVDWPVPEPGPGEVRVRVLTAAVCASDVHIYHDRFTYVPPLVLGHEFCGIVEQAGPGVDRVRVGDRVVSENNPSACGVCRICRAGYPNLCPEKKAIGFKSDGCFADYLKLPAGLLHRVPDGVSSEAASLSEPLAVAVHAVADRCGIEAGDTVVVLGPGAVGLLAAQVARAEGAGRVIVAGTDADEAVRLACARRLGFETCNVQREEIRGRVDAIGADVVVEASGSPRAVASGIDLLRRAGRMVVLGITGRPELTLAWDALVAKGATVAFSYSSRRANWDLAMRYLAERKVDAGALVSDRMPLERWREAFDRMEALDGIRFLLTMSPEAA